MINIGDIYTGHDFDLNSGLGKEITSMLYVISYNADKDTYNCLAFVKLHNKIYRDFGKDAWGTAQIKTEHRVKSDEKTLLKYLFTFMKEAQ